MHFIIIDSLRLTIEANERIAHSNTEGALGGGGQNFLKPTPDFSIWSQ